jgi:hypothetical protein
MDKMELDVRRCTISAWLIAALLAGCGGPQAQAPFFVAPPSILAEAHATKADGQSWMLPQAAGQDLLYVGNLNAGVTVYTYPQGKLVGNLMGFNQPRGLCVDRAGNVFVTDFNGAKIVEYAHGGTKPIATLADDGSPYGCAVSPTTGDVAVTNWCDGPSGSCYSNGTVLIYKKAQGKPETLDDPNVPAAMTYCAYDKAGNLFVDSYGKQYDIGFAELPAGSKTFETLTLELPKSAEFAGGLQWVGKYLAVGFGDGNVVGEYRIQGNTATRVEATPLKGVERGFGTNQFWAVGTRLVAPIIPTQEHPNGIVEFFKYPEGGKPAGALTNGVSNPFAAAISPATT